MDRKELLDLIEKIKTTNPGKEILVNFLKNSEEKIDKELVELIIFFSGMLVSYDEINLKAETLDNLREIQETYGTKIEEIVKEIVDINEKLNPTATG